MFPRFDLFKKFRFFSPVSPLEVKRISGYNKFLPFKFSESIGERGTLVSCGI